MSFRAATAIYITAVLLASVGAAAEPLHPHVAGGSARVVDGDTLEIWGERVRLYGIDAPERGQTCFIGDQPWACGDEARAALARLIKGRLVSCIEKDRDRYGRMVGLCMVVEPYADLGQEMVRSGYALAYRKYSDKYVVTELEAQAARAGLWRGSFTAPWDWRQKAGR